MIKEPLDIQLTDARGAGYRTASALLQYNPADPLAVQMIFPPELGEGGCEVTWSFARDLLAQGVHAPAGQGDVQVFPFTCDRTQITLSVPHGHVDFTASTHRLRDFLRATEDLVAVGRESDEIDWDAELAGLLDDRA